MKKDRKERKKRQRDQDPSDEHEDSLSNHSVSSIGSAGDSKKRTRSDKDSPLTDIATSPPFDLHLEEPYKSDTSELSDVDDSEAETDKMDFLDDEGPSDLHVLARLTRAEIESDNDSDPTHDLSTIKVEHSPKTVSSPLPTKIASPTPKIEINVGSENAQNKNHFSISPNDMSVPAEMNPADNDISNDAEVQTATINDLDTIPEPDTITHEPLDSAHLSSEDNKVPLSHKANSANSADSDDPADSAGSADPADQSDQSDTPLKKEEPHDSNHINHTQNNIQDETNAIKETETSRKSSPPESANPSEADPEDEDEVEEHDDNEEPKMEIDDVDLNEQRKLAVEELVSIENAFAELRDKLYNDKLNLLERELQLCLEGSHPELSKIYFRINGFYQENVRLANYNLSYKLRCVDKETRATRTSVHQDFLKRIMDYKNDMITNTTSLWYKINRERNEIDQLVPEYGFQAIPQIPNVTVAGSADDDDAVPLTKKQIKQNTLVEMVHQRNRVNEQIGALQGLIKFHGFPSAVNADDLGNAEVFLRRATDEEIGEDLTAMGII